VRYSVVQTQEFESTAMNLHALQVRAFINASEDVDIDQETLNDILEGSGTLADDNAEKGTSGTESEDDEDERESTVTEEDADGYLDISALYATKEEGAVVSIMSGFSRDVVLKYSNSRATSMDQARNRVYDETSQGTR
jgi:ribosomal protein L12E/L44/L45/RPP1/RPP2